MSEISKTGFWDGETAHHHHVHSDKLSEWICNFIIEQEIETLTDFGCGLGQYCDDVESQTLCVALGIEGNRPKNSVHRLIVEKDLTTDLIYDMDLTSELALSLEVGEHIPSEHMATYLDNITYHATQYLITSWAVRGQDGFGHVNCLDNHEILPEFEKRGFILMKKETEDARAVIEDKCWWFRNTLFILKTI